MKNSLRSLLLVLATGLVSFTLHAQQDPQLSMYMFDKMAVDPAAAGTKDAMEATLISRDQWLNIPGAPITNALMISAPVGSQKIGWGAEIMNDRLGPTSSTSIQGNYSYHLRVLKGQLSMGLGLSAYDYVIDFTKINYKDPSDPYATMGNSQKIVPNAEFGLYYYSNTFYAGASVNHLIQAKLTNGSLDSTAAFRPHAYLIMGQGFQFSPNVLFSPSLMVKVAKNSPATGDINLDFLLQQKLWLGVGYRSQYGFMFLVAYRASNLFQVGYTYDLGLNEIGVVGGGTHEISLTFDFGRNKTVQTSPRYL